MFFVWFFYILFVFMVVGLLLWFFIVCWLCGFDLFVFDEFSLCCVMVCIEVSFEIVEVYEILVNLCKKIGFVGLWGCI